MGDSGTLFDVLDRKQKLFRRREDMPGMAHPLLARFVPPLTAEVYRGRAAPDAHGGAGPINLRQVTEHTLPTQYAETGVLVSGRGEIFHIFGRSGRYLEPAAGDAGMNVIAMAREGLRQPLTSSLYQVVARKEPVTHQGLRVKTNGDFANVDLTLRPALGTDGTMLHDMFLVILKESQAPATLPEPAPPAVNGEDPALGDNTRIAHLEQELRNKEEYLKSTLEEMETSNEELKSTNEEMQSVNEELQSTNEELETSKEELQPVNEELATVNAELQNKVADLSRANNDMNNLLAGTGIATLFVDHQLHVVRFTPSATEMINLIQADVGRPVAHIVTNLIQYDRLVADIREVLRDLVPREVEVQTREGGCFLMRIRPYRTLENVIEGAVITFTDITQNKETWKMLEERERQMKALVKGMFNACVQFQSVFDDDGGFVGCRFVFINDAYERMMGVTGRQVSGKTVDEVWPDMDPGWIASCGKAVDSGEPSSFEMDHPSGSKRFRCHVSRMGEGREYFYVIFEERAAP